MSGGKGKKKRKRKREREREEINRQTESMIGLIVRGTMGR